MLEPFPGAHCSESQRVACSCCLGDSDELFNLIGAYLPPVFAGKTAYLFHEGMEIKTLPIECNARSVADILDCGDARVPSDQETWLLPSDIPA